MAEPDLPGIFSSPYHSRANSCTSTSSIAYAADVSTRTTTVASSEASSGNGSAHTSSVDLAPYVIWLDRLNIKDVKDYRHGTQIFELLNNGDFNPQFAKEMKCITNMVMHLRLKIFTCGKPKPKIDIATSKEAKSLAIQIDRYLVGVQRQLDENFQNIKSLKAVMPSLDVSTDLQDITTVMKIWTSRITE